MNQSDAWARMSASKSGCDVLMERLHSTSFSPSAAGQLIVGPRGQLEPPFSRLLVDSGKVVDSGRYGNWAIGHGSKLSYWDRGTPRSSRPPSSGAHEELASMNRSSLEKFLPGSRPRDTTFQRIWGREDLPRYTGEVARTSPMICSKPVDDFMLKYLENQAKIEHLLHKQQGRLFPDKGARPAPEARAPKAAVELAPQVEVREVEPVPEPSVEILARTENTTLTGALLQNAEWSGGVLFARPAAQEFSFELSVSPEADPETHPIFIGIAAPGADLTQANFFASAGVFLCLGGTASDGRLGALGAPGGPYVQSFGQRLRAKLPKGHAKCRVQLNYTEAVDDEGQLLGHVCFMVSDLRGLLPHF
ncbi:unnamed protein product [Effrenium voratum]|nr:unnamed protein product [Effrenium voratum]